MNVNDLNPAELVFYPAHPSNEKTKLIETTPMPLLAQEKPFEVKALREGFDADLEGSLQTYLDKRFEVTGYALKVGPDIHNKPSIEISDFPGGVCHALCIFPKDDFYSRVKVGDKVVVCANYLVHSNLFGVVMKHSELISAE